MTAAPPTLSLANLGNVPQTYKHEWRVATPREPIILPNTIFKWYHIHREGVPVPPEMDAEARATLIDAVTNSPWTPEYGLNYAMLHVSTAHAFLSAGVNLPVP